MTIRRDYAKLAFQFAPDATLVLSRRVVLKASDMVKAVFGWAPQELEGKSVRVLYPAAGDFELIGARARVALQEQEIYRDERFMRLKSGQVVWMQGCGRALEQSDPEALAIWTYRPVPTGRLLVDILTPAENRIAHYLVNGFTSKEIAQALECSPRTVEVHRANMIAKIKVRNSSELVSHLLQLSMN